MFDRHSALSVFVCVISLVGLAHTPAAYGGANPINLEWRPDTQTVLAGATVDVGLYAVYDDVGGTTDGSISAIDAMLAWNPTFLELTGVNNNGPYGWLASGFPDDSGFDGLNDTWLDGNALYNAMSQFNPAPPAFATPDGLLVTTVQFEALAETPETFLTIPVDYGAFTYSRVFDGEIPGFEVQGTLGSAAITIVPEPTALCLIALPLLAGLARRRRC